MNTIHGDKKFNRTSQCHTFGCAHALYALLARCWVICVWIGLCGLGAAQAVEVLSNAAAARWAQLADPVFSHLSAEQGLPNPAVTALAEDANGFIWVGTQGGLARWDGYRFRVYQPDPKDATSLPDNWIQVLHTDRRGRLWVGTHGGLDHILADGSIKHLRQGDAT